MEKEGKKCECGAWNKDVCICGDGVYENGIEVSSPLLQEEQVQEPHNFVQSQGASKISGGSLPNHEPAKDGNGNVETGVSPEWEERLEDLAAINYNMYFGSPADRSDMFDKEGEKVKWSYDEALKELKDFIASEIRLAEERLVKRILDKPHGSEHVGFGEYIEYIAVEDIVSIAKGEE